jgi:transcriptional regulator with XRE-family HTH domain
MVHAMTTSFGAKMLELMGEQGLSLRRLAKQMHYDDGHLSKISRDLKRPSEEMAGRLDAALGADGALVALVPPRRKPSRGVLDTVGPELVDDELEALELTRRAAASDVGAETVRRLESAVDDLAVAYPGTSPGELLERVGRHLAYVAQLLNARKTLVEHRRLLVVGSWLSLLAATCHIDLHQRPAAIARLRTAATLARDAEHREIAAWCLETEAWQALTEGDYRQAVTLARGAQVMAPRASSAYLQASAQEGRAWARLGAARETHELLDRVNAVASSLPTPEQPEHHYRYDPGKADAYTATTLAWLGDPNAEPYARQVLARMKTPADGSIRLRRMASARLDLSLSLVATNQLDEAADETLTAVTSGVLVPSNYWRAAEIIDALEASRVPEAADLRQAYRHLCGPAASALNV